MTTGTGGSGIGVSDGPSVSVTGNVQHFLRSHRPDPDVATPMKCHDRRRSAKVVIQSLDLEIAEGDRAGPDAPVLVSSTFVRVTQDDMRSRARDMKLRLRIRRSDPDVAVVEVRVAFNVDLDHVGGATAVAEKQATASSRRLPNAGDCASARIRSKEPQSETREHSEERAVHDQAVREIENELAVAPCAQLVNERFELDAAIEAGPPGDLHQCNLDRCGDLQSW